MKTKLLTLSLVFAILACAMILIAGNPASTKKVITLSEKPGNLPFSPAILVNNTLYISGHLAVNPKTGKFENGTMAQQTDLILGNISALLKKAGFDRSHVVKTTCFITDFNEFGEFNKAYKKYFPNDPPTRATVQVAKLARDAKIEISAIAVK